jgi:hypothetical protein
VTLTRVSKQVLLVNAILAGLAVFCVVSLIRDLTHVRSLPPPPAPRRAAAPRVGDDPAVSVIRGETLGAYNVIVAKHLFNPSRSEGGAVAAAATAPPAQKPMLLGVVVDGGRSRAYLEDPASKRVLSYQVGDTVSGGRLEEITSERVLIVRPDGPVEVMLRDPLKPKPAPAPSAGGAPPVGSGPRIDNPVVPPRPQAPPTRALRRPGTEPPPAQQ